MLTFKDSFKDFLKVAFKLDVLLPFSLVNFEVQFLNGKTTRIPLWYSLRLAQKSISLCSSKLQYLLEK